MAGSKLLISKEIPNGIAVQLPLATRPVTEPTQSPDLPDPRIAAMRRQRLEELKRKKGRRATILTAGLGARTETTRQPVRNRTFPLLPGAPHTADTLLGAESNFGKGRSRVRLPGKKHTAPNASRPGPPILTDPLVQLVSGGQPPTPLQLQQPAPQMPERRPPDPCLIERLEAQARNQKVMEVRRKQGPIQEQINKLKDEIAALRREQDLETGPTAERPSEGAGGGKPSGSGGHLSRILRIGGKALPLVSAILTAKGVIDSVNRSQMIAAAQQQLAVLEQELQSLEKEEAARERDFAEALRNLETCEFANKR